MTDERAQIRPLPDTAERKHRLRFRAAALGCVAGDGIDSPPLASMEQACRELAHVLERLTADDAPAGCAPGEVEDGSRRRLAC
ncbi:hypothetical protein [Streptomyces herbicida]|uniref:hypothetical protein n=1 Tax=Streptomyces herbicida TaxID=3065675 RepID=UPI0029314E83|nr:hypothetical protein [Streptomyces sp. NEAU-HV9]